MREKLMFSDGICNMVKAVGNKMCSEVCEAAESCISCPIAKAFDKLAEYEKLEAEGRLVIKEKTSEK